MKDFTTIAIMAESDHGKDFCGQWIVKNKNFVDLAFADHIKRLCSFVLEFGYMSLWGDAKSRNEGLKVDWDRAEHRLTWYLDDWLFELASLKVEEKANYKPIVQSWFRDIRARSEKTDPPGNTSPRIALQLLGTEYGRKFRKDIWSSFVMDYVIPEIKAGRDYKRSVGTTSLEHKADVKNGAIITDCRFGSELVSVQAAGGYVIKIIRNSKVGEANTALTAGIANHSSEIELQSIPDEAFDLVLAMDDGEDNVYPRLRKMFDEMEFTKKRQSGQVLWSP